MPHGSSSWCSTILQASPPPRRVAAPEPERERESESPLGNLIDSIRVPVGDSGVEVGVDLDRGDVTVGPSRETPEPDPADPPVQLAPPPPRAGEDEG